ncbi:MAG: YicC/YloC family endoribonuclease [Desulfovibrionaceae bacterium]|nr:YicC/YloC family endoribonuclease [Desulfovibrionaceae bacterium]
MRSMTGFGRCIMENRALTQQWEIRSVNGKRLDLKWSLPPVVSNLENHFEKIVRAHASRGRVDISLSLQLLSADLDQHFDFARARGMLQALEALAAERGDTYAPDYSSLLNIPVLWNSSLDDVDEETVATLEQGLTLALEDWNESRETEGAALAHDLLARVLRLEQWTDILRDRAPAIKDERTETLRERLNEAVSALSLSELAETRFLQEAVILLDRLDVTEELTRLATHLERLRELLQSESDAGRRLDFTLQECFREITTCGNKIPDVQLSRLVVDYKNELEKCREQAQNLE